MQSDSAKAPDCAREGVPFSGTDVIMVDKTQAQLFSALGRTRSLFGGVADWPSLDQALGRRSRQVLEDKGEVHWFAAGGTYDPSGKPTCLLTSPMAAQVVAEIAAEVGGLLWTDPDGAVWAVRLVPADSRDSSFYGFAIGGAILNGVPDDRSSRPARRRKARAGQGKLEMARLQLGSRACRLRLAGRAEQLLWAIHLVVVSQRRSVILMPDALLGQIVWGGNRRHWPQDWRRDLFQTLRSLTELRSEVLRMSSAGWRPQLGAHSVAVAGVEQLWVTRPDQDFCRPSCPMWGLDKRHSHFVIQAGLGFLGALEMFATGKDVGNRSYDFLNLPAEEQGEELKAAQKAGQLITVSAPAAVFAPSKWSKLSNAHARIIQALVGEITRVLPPRKPTRSDNAEILVGNLVPGSRSKVAAACPLLEIDDRYVACNGNGHRRGMGYLIVGVEGQGWLNKCGYSIPKDTRKLARVVRQFLMDLRRVGGLLNLTVVGLEPKAMEWLGLEEMLASARSLRGVQRLLGVHLRIYGPENFHERCRNYFRRKGRFAAIPGGADEDTGQSEPVDVLDLAARIRLARIKQVEMADHLGVSQPFVSQLLNNDRPWPAWAKERAEAFVEQRISLASADEEVA